MADDRFTQLDRERLEVLAGTRQKAARPKAAIRIEDLAAIMDMPKLQSIGVSGSPTEGEFNLLVSEMVDLHRRIASVAERLRLRMEPE